MLGNGTSTARMELGSMPFFLRPWSTETWMMAPSVGVAITLPLRSCMLVIAESFRTIRCVLGLSLVSIPCPATATTSIPASTALMRSGGVDGAKSNWRPSVPGSTDRFCVTDSVTSRPFFSKKPFSLATHAGSHETTGIYAARTGVSCAAVEDAMPPAPIHKILAATTANERDNFSFCAIRAPPAKPSPVTLLLHLVRGEFEAAYFGLADMLERVLRRAVRPRLQAEDDERRILAEYIKKENGAALTTPSLPTVVTRAIGRGTTSAASSL